MKYIRLEDCYVREIIPEFDSAFPDVPIKERFPADFVSELLPVEDSVSTPLNSFYDASLKKFVPPDLDDRPVVVDTTILPSPNQDRDAMLVELAHKMTLLELGVK